MKTTIWMVERKVKEKAREKAESETDDLLEQDELAEKYEDQLLGKIFDMVHRGEIEIYGARRMQKTLEQRINELEKKVAELEGRVPVQHLTTKDLVALLQNREGVRTINVVPHDEYTHLVVGPAKLIEVID